MKKATLSETKAKAPAAQPWPTPGAWRDVFDAEEPPKVCGKNHCVTPLEDRDGRMWCVNCGWWEAE